VHLGKNAYNVNANNVRLIQNTQILMPLPRRRTI